MDATKRKHDIDSEIDNLKRDGTRTTLNKANQLLFDYKDKLTVEQRLKLEVKMQCLICNRIYCDHPRPE